MSQRFLNLIRQGKTAEVASAAEENPTLVACTDAQGISALLVSVYNRQPLIRDFLLSRLDALDVFEAAAVGDSSKLEPLLRKNAAAVHETSADGWGALHLAAAFGGLEVTRLLLEHGAHLHKFSQNPMHSQPLHACIALSQDLETVQFLIAQGADVNARQGGGFTPLHQAAAAGAGELVRLLLDAGADPKGLCDRGKTAQDYARERGHLEVANLLR